MARIAFIGGTGPEGIGLAIRFAKSGNAVFIGSRTEEKAAEAVAQVMAAVPEGEIYGGWESESLAGHTLGHYLSACSLMFAQTGETDVRTRATLRSAMSAINEAIQEKCRLRELELFS